MYLHSFRSDAARSSRRGVGGVNVVDDVSAGIPGSEGTSPCTVRKSFLLNTAFVVREWRGDPERTPQTEGRPLSVLFVTSGPFQRARSFLVLPCVLCGAFRDVLGHGLLKKKRTRGKQHSVLIHPLIFCEPYPSKSEVHGCTCTAFAQMPPGPPDEG